MTLNEWDKEIEAMSLHDLTRFGAALETLRDWDSLYKEFGWTGLWLLRRTIEVEQNRRAK